MSSSTPTSFLLPAHGWDEHWESTFNTVAGHAAGAVPARVLRTERGLCEVITDRGPARVGLRPAQHTGSGTGPTTGDWIAVLPATDTAAAMLEAVLPRRTALARAGADGNPRGQLLAANVDTVLIAVSLAAPVRRARTERLLALAWESGARPVVALTQADTHPDPQAAREELASVALGVDVLLTSAPTGEGITELRAVLEGTIVLLGASGVGKSMLGNRLLGTDLLATGPVRAVGGKGRHTTAWRELRPLPRGGVLLDTPGLRSIGLTGADEGVSHTFADLEDLAAQCRFSDCRHHTEPGCAVLAAIANGTLQARRLESYRKLQRETAWMASRTDARARAERTGDAKTLTKHLRAGCRGRERPR